MNLEKICEQVVEISRVTGKFIKNELTTFSQQHVETKGIHNFVSYVDKTAEEKIVSALTVILPNAGFIAEEGTGKPSENGLNWVIDPLDGTTNYIHGLPPFAISIALMQGEQVILGVVYEISLDECFWAYTGSDAFLNGKKINVSNIETVNDSLIATGFPYYDYNRMEPFLKSIEYFMRNSHGLRRLGSAATDLAYVACGRFEAFYEYGLQSWDVAAGSLIVQQAGGKVIDFTGKKNYIFGKEIIASNSNIFTEFQRITKYFMVK
ncbi:MAG: inositol monophosphatase [Bacteroidales bacterium]|nr:MAG: inositol monophosphatase [Bacteroidales bacterium]